jgi:hypothetical protein
VGSEGRGVGLRVGWFFPVRKPSASSRLDCGFGSQAANYLNIKELLDLTCLTVANMIKGTFVLQSSV